MKTTRERTAALLTMALFAFSAVGVPLVEYACALTGEAGVAIYRDEAVEGCYTEACCGVGGENATLREGCCRSTVRWTAPAEQSTREHPIQVGAAAQWASEIDAPPSCGAAAEARRSRDPTPPVLVVPLRI